MGEGEGVPLDWIAYSSTSVGIGLGSNRSARVCRSSTFSSVPLSAFLGGMDGIEAPNSPSDPRPTLVQPSSSTTEDDAVVRPGDEVVCCCSSAEGRMTDMLCVDAGLVEDVAFPF